MSRPSNTSRPDPKTGVELVSPDEQRVGTVIDGRYRLDAMIGRGGMGVVYKAEHVGIRRVCALKLLHASLAQVPELRSRFEREARAIGVISHPNCVDITDFGELADGSLYLVMEYLEGRSLGDLLDAEKALEPRRALRILRHVLRGLGHAHEVGIIHRDIKPENVFLVTQGADADFAKILDFGIAKLLAQQVDDGVKLTQAGVAFGTPVYMSPEQALGNPADGRADLYAASVLTYEMICGRPPFYSDDKLEVLSMHTARPVPPMAELRRRVLGDAAPPVPTGIERVVMKGLAKRPTERWSTAAEYIAAIDEVLVGMQLDDASLGDVHDGDVTREHGGAAPLVTQTGRSLIAAEGPRRSTAPGGGASTALTPTRPSTAAPDPISEPIELTRARASSADVDGLGDEATRLLGARAASSGGGAPDELSATSRRAPARAPTLADRARGWASVRRNQAIVAGVALLVLAIVIALLRGDDTPPKPSQAAVEAAEKLERGDPGAAIEGLQTRAAEIASDPQAQLQLGHAHAVKREHAPALLAYRRALELQPSLERDPQLRQHLTTISKDPDLAGSMEAYEILITQTKDPEAKARLLATASGDDQARRRAAGALAERLGIAGEVDWLAAHVQDLAQGEVCAERKEAVAKLRALGDPRAIEALELAIKRKGKSGKLKGKPVNTCLVEDARAAIRHLQDLGGGGGL
jgi:serine/threonine-protein kinase